MSRFLCVCVLSLLAHGLLQAQSAAPSERIQRGALQIEGIPEIPENLRETLNRYNNVRGARVHGWMPDDGGLVIGTRLGATEQLYLVKQPLGMRQQLTFEPEPVLTATVSPVPTQLRIAFLQDRGGDENFRLRVLDMGSGLIADFSPPRSRNTSPLWRPGGASIAYASTWRNGRDTDVRVLQFTDIPGSEDWIERGGSWRPMAWSADGQRLLVQRYRAITDTELGIVDAATRSFEPVPGLPSPVGIQAALFAEDADSILVVSDADGDFQSLSRINLKTGKREAIGPRRPWNLEQIQLAPDLYSLAMNFNVDGGSEVLIWNLREDRQVASVALQGGVISGLHFNQFSSRLAFTLSAANRPADAFVLNLANNQVEQWTESEAGGIPRDRFRPSETIRYPSFDKVDGKAREIPALVYRPSGAGPHPVVIMIHGGPESQIRPAFQSFVQFLVSSMQIAVVAPNVRGSSGYGKTYLDLDNGMQRLDSVRDIGALLDWIKDQPDLNAERVAVYGGSYGGYMVLASMIEYGERISAGVSIVGISDFTTFLTNTNDYRRDLRRAEYGDERDPKMRAYFDRISPLRNADRIRSPLFLVQGANDPRVPASEAEQILSAVKKKGSPAWFLMAMDEGHGFRKKDNQQYLSEASALFFATHLLDYGKQPAAAETSK